MIKWLTSCVCFVELSLFLIYRPLTIILYLLFLFLVVIILLNVLIAQVSATYTAVQSTTRASFLFHRSRFITRCEESTALWFLLWTFRWKKLISSYCLHCDVESQTYANQRHPKVDWHSKWSPISLDLLDQTYLVSLVCSVQIDYCIDHSILLAYDSFSVYMMLAINEQFFLRILL